MSDKFQVLRATLDDYLRAYEQEGYFSGSVLVARGGEFCCTKATGRLIWSMTSGTVLIPYFADLGRRILR